MKKIKYIVFFIMVILVSGFSSNKTYTLDYIRKCDSLNIDENINKFASFYKIEMDYADGEKRILLIGSTKIYEDDRSAFDFDKKNVKTAGKVKSIKITDNIHELVSNDNFFEVFGANVEVYSAQIIDSSNEKKIVILYEYPKTKKCLRKGKNKHEDKKSDNKPADKKSSDKNNKSSDKNNKSSDKNKKIEEQAYKKLDEALTDAGIGAIETGMGALGIAGGHIAGGAVSCAAGAYELKKAYNNFKEAKELFDKSRNEEQSTEYQENKEEKECLDIVAEEENEEK